MSDVWAAVGGVSAGLAGVAIVARWVKSSAWAAERSLDKRNIRQMSRDWVGEESRPGFEGREPFPERFHRVEKRTEVLQHDFATETTGRLTLIGNTVDEIKAQSSDTTKAVARLDFRVNGMDQRITDHRRRNEEQAELLRAEIERRDKAQHARAAAIEERLGHISDDLLRAETMRAVLLELGIPIDPPEHH